jgi:hypothetical protein
LQIAGYDIAVVEEEINCTNVTAQQSIYVACLGIANFHTGDEI